MLKKQTYVTYYFLFIAILFLLSSTRSYLINEVMVEWMLFLSIIGGVYITTRVRATWIVFYNFILILFYNPFFLVFHNIQYSYIADIGIAVSFFFLALKWQLYAFEEVME